MSTRPDQDQTTSLTGFQYRSGITPSSIQSNDGRSKLAILCQRRRWSHAKVHLRIDHARVVPLDDDLIEDLAARVADVALALVQPSQRAAMAGMATGLGLLAGDG